MAFLTIFFTISSCTCSLSMFTVIDSAFLMTQHQWFLPPEGVNNNVYCSSSHMNVKRTTYSSLCRTKSMDTAAAAAAQIMMPVTNLHAVIYLHKLDSISSTAATTRHRHSPPTDDPCFHGFLLMNSDQPYGR